MTGYALEGRAWYEATVPGDCCSDSTHCADVDPDTGDCDTCDSIDGRWIEAVSNYAQTCSGCAELTHNDMLSTDKQTQLGYCEDCAKARGLPPYYEETLYD